MTPYPALQQGLLIIVTAVTPALAMWDYLFPISLKLRQSVLLFPFTHCNSQVAIPWQTGSCASLYGRNLKRFQASITSSHHPCFYLLFPPPRQWQYTWSWLLWGPPKLCDCVLIPSADLYHSITTALWSEAGRIRNDWKHQRETALLLISRLHPALDAMLAGDHIVTESTYLASWSMAVPLYC